MTRDDLIAELGEAAVLHLEELARNAPPLTDEQRHALGILLKRPGAPSARDINRDTGTAA